MLSYSLFYEKFIILNTENEKKLKTV